MAHQLGEPLTALLLCLHELKQAGDRPQGTESASARSILDMALREAQRVCDIIERVGTTVETLVDVEAAVARGREAIEMWAQDNQTRPDGAAARVHLRVHPHPLTPREHEVLALIVGGASNKEGGHRLAISTRTFEAHRAHLMGKLGARNVADLIRKMSSQNQ
jgi:DNA-binding NarL/FixJ family response regulator